MTGRPFTPEDDARIAAGYGRHERVKSIALDLGRSPAAIRKRAAVLRAAGLPVVSLPRGCKSNLTPEQRRQRKAERRRMLATLRGPTGVSRGRSPDAAFAALLAGRSYGG